MTEQAQKTDAWMPLWIGDYLADTMSLNTAQHGAYLLLLVAYWRNKGPLPDDDGDLASTVRATPGEWKKLRPKMLKFFDVEDGAWSHSRANKELQRAGLFAKKAHERAVKAAAARWGAKEDPGGKQQACTKLAPSTASGQLGPCPTPSPSPTTGIQTGVAKDETPSLSADEGGFEQVRAGTDAGRICKAMKSAGIADVNPGHQMLLTLLQAGADEAEFVGAAREAVKKQAGFAYALTVVTNGRKRAAEMAGQLHTGRMPAAQQPTETAHGRKMRETVQGLAPGVARRPTGHAAPTPLTIDMEAPHAPAIASN